MQGFAFPMERPSRNRMHGHHDQMMSGEDEEPVLQHHHIAHRHKGNTGDDCRGGQRLRPPAIASEPLQGIVADHQQLLLPNVKAAGVMQEALADGTEDIAEIIVLNDPMGFEDIDPVIVRREDFDGHLEPAAFRLDSSERALEAEL